MNSFFYGNPYNDDPTEPRVIPLIASSLNENVSFGDSTFKLSNHK